MSPSSRPGRPSVIPSLLPGTDLKSLPLRPEEGFVLSRIDGTASARDLALATGLSVAQIEPILQRLAELGAISLPDLDDEPEPSTQPRPPRSSRGHASGVHSSAPEARRSSTGIRRAPDIRSSSPDIRPSSPEIRPSSPDIRPSSPEIRRSSPFPPSHSSAPAPATSSTSGVRPGPTKHRELEAWARRAVIEIYERIDTIDHYAALGVSRDADRKKISKRYNEMVRAFHPDRYYGQELGDLYPKLVAVFGRLNEAYEVLGNKRRRAEYDGTIGNTPPERKKSG